MQVILEGHDETRPFRLKRGNGVKTSLEIKIVVLPSTS